MEAAALIEFAVALPLLVVLVVGIFDFGGAFNLKQELNNAVREGANFGASQPTNDLALTKPPSVDAVRYLVASYLQASRITSGDVDTGQVCLVRPPVSAHVLPRAFIRELIASIPPRERRQILSRGSFTSSACWLAQTCSRAGQNHRP